jgi:hypothetical protein
MNIFLFWPSTADRAYYKALGAVPEADAVFYKSMDREHDGIPFIWTSETVTFRGKALRLKSDEELYGPSGSRAAKREILGYRLKTDSLGNPLKGKDGKFVFDIVEADKK